MIVHFFSNFLGYFISSLLILQYFGSNGAVLNTGINHTLILQCLFCIMSVPILYIVNKKSTLKIIGVILCFIIFSGAHYDAISRINDYFFSLTDLWSYVKFGFYLFVFLVIYFYLKAKDFVLILKCAKFILLILFFESLVFLTTKALGFQSFSNLFILDSGGARFAGIFLMNNSLVGLFSLFVMSNVVFFGNFREKFIYLIIGTILIFLTGERSIFLGFLFLMFAYLLFSYDENNIIYKDKFKIFIIITLIFIGFVILYTISYREETISSIWTFLRPFLIRIYFSYLSIIHLFESGNSIFGFGPFVSFLPVSVADMYTDHIEKFINAMSTIFGHGAKVYFTSFHDSGNPFSASYTINAHNTFVLLFYQFGYAFICVLFYFLYLYYFSLNYIKNYLKQISLLSKLKDTKNINENFFQLSSLVFIFASIPPLFFLSMGNYLLLIIIALGHLGSLRFKEKNV